MNNIVLPTSFHEYFSTFINNKTEVINIQEWDEKYWKESNTSCPCPPRACDWPQANDCLKKKNIKKLFDDLLIAKPKRVNIPPKKAQGAIILPILFLSFGTQIIDENIINKNGHKLVENMFCNNMSCVQVPLGANADCIANNRYLPKKKKGIQIAP